jgi:hypothetical protein
MRSRHPTRCVGRLQTQCCAPSDLSTIQYKSQYNFHNEKNGCSKKAVESNKDMPTAFLLGRGMRFGGGITACYSAKNQTFRN